MNKELQRANRAEAGFTLVELMLVVSIVGLLAALAVPAAREFSRAYRLRATADELAMTLEMARARAVEINQSVGVIIDANQGTWGADEDFDGSISEAERHTLPGGVSLSPSQTITFSSRGELTIGAEVAAVQISNGQDSRSISVSPRGRVQVQ